jgi:thioredoxin reductase
MNNTEKNCLSAKRNNAQTTLFHETENLLKAADPQQVPQIILNMLQQLDGKVELHVHFIVNSVISDNVIGDNINVVRNTTSGNHSSINSIIAVGNENVAASVYGDVYAEKGGAL